MSIKNVFKKAAGLFVEIPEDGQDFSDFAATLNPAPVAPVTPRPNPTPTPVVVPKISVNEIVQRTSGPNLDEINLTEEQAQEALAPGGVPDFEKVYAKASLPKVGFGAEQAIEVIASLPADLPIQVKRSTVQATLTAMGKAMNQSASVNIESVVADASRKIAALQAFEGTLNLQSNKHIATMQADIQAHQEKIALLNAEIAKTQESLTKALSLCEAESGKLDDVLEFFTLDEGTSKNAPSQ